MNQNNMGSLRVKSKMRARFYTFLWSAVLVQESINDSKFAITDYWMFAMAKLSSPRNCLHGLIVFLRTF